MVFKLLALLFLHYILTPKEQGGGGGSSSDDSLATALKQAQAAQAQAAQAQAAPTSQVPAATAQQSPLPSAQTAPAGAPPPQTTPATASPSASPSSAAVPPWPAADASSLPPFPSGWEPDQPPPAEVVARANALLSSLWAKGEGATAQEMTGGRWVTYQATNMHPYKGVVAWRIRGSEPGSSPATAAQQAVAPSLHPDAATVPAQQAAITQAAEQQAAAAHAQAASDDTFDASPGFDAGKAPGGEQQGTDQEPNADGTDEGAITSGVSAPRGRSRARARPKPPTGGGKPRAKRAPPGAPKLPTAAQQEPQDQGGGGGGDQGGGDQGGGDDGQMMPSYDPGPQFDSDPQDTQADDEDEAD